MDTRHKYNQGDIFSINKSDNEAKVEEMPEKTNLEGTIDEKEEKHSTEEKGKTKGKTGERKT